MRIIHDIVYDTARPDSCLLDVYYPQEGTLPRRTFVYFHGGGLEGGEKEDFGQHAGLLTAGGTIVVSAAYRVYPEAAFPDFVEDAAKAVAWAARNLPGELYVGGSSAGSYLSMMLYFDRRYLAAEGVDADSVAGWAFDAGQPTTHYNVLRERGLNTQLVRVDEAAPIWFVDDARFAEIAGNGSDIPSGDDSVSGKNAPAGGDPADGAAKNACGKKYPRILILCSDNDLPGRLEQNRLLIRTMEIFGFPAEEIDFRLMEGFSHCEYNGLPLFGEILAEFLNGK